MQSVHHLHSTKSDQRLNLARWYGVHTVLPGTHSFIHEWNEPSCINFVSIHQMASPTKLAHIWISLLLNLSTPIGRKAVLDVLFTSGHPSYRSSVRQGKFVCQRPAFYHCATQPTYPLYWGTIKFPLSYQCLNCSYSQYCTG